MELTERYEKLHKEYTPKALALLQEIADAVSQGEDVEVGEPFDTNGDYMWWGLIIKKGEHLVVCDLRLHFESEFENDVCEQDAGVLFGLDLVTESGLVVGSISIHRYGSKCWAAKTDETICERWKEFESAVQWNIEKERLWPVVSKGLENK